MIAIVITGLICFTVLLSVLAICSAYEKVRKSQLESYEIVNTKR